ncbi:hypothetical protein VQH23_04870 [Pararoseomonas sp. SCSIO 73927]|uniref:hypothetical protein n=1 Tax=Pararoseomonas sp. SCSIO 73927 TaxID=3114537 RepID=UPI0030CA9BE6
MMLAAATVAVPGHAQAPSAVQAPAAGVPQAAVPGAAQAGAAQPAAPGTAEAAAPAVAAGPAPADWRTRPFDYAVVDQDLREVLIELGKRVGLNAVVSEGVRGRVRGRLARGTAIETLERLAAIYGLDWFTDGSTLHVSSVGEAVSRLVDLGGVPPAQLDAALRALGVHDARWPIRASDPNLGLAMVSGPPRYVGLVEQTLAVLARRPRPDGTPQTEPARIRVFRGRTERAT